MSEQRPSVEPRQYPAGLCDASTDADQTDWYLPAICELSYSPDGRATDCGSAGQPTLQNVQSALLDRFSPQPLGQLVGSLWWTSTETGLVNSSRAYHYEPDRTLWISSKTTPRGVACVRKLSP